MLYPVCLLGMLGIIPSALADRGNAPSIPPTICDIGAALSGATDVPPTTPPVCEHAADPSGSQGICPLVASVGWCDCGSNGIYPILAGYDICGYSSLDGIPTLDLPKCTTKPVKREEPTTTPASRHRRANQLAERNVDQILFKANCNAAIPDGNSYNKQNGFTTMGSVLRHAYTDAVTLARFAQDVDITNVGFQHYFGGDQVDLQHTHFVNMMKGITSVQGHYSIEFDCDNAPSCPQAKNQNAVFHVDPSPGSAQDVKVITACPEFWTTKGTRYLLGSDPDPPATSSNPPFRPYDKSLQGWCDKKTVKGDPNASVQDHQFFATAGHSVLHELTHLDALGQFVGLEPEGDKHGTDDYQSLCEFAGARKFLKDYIAGNTLKTSPDYAAESYAAAASEIFFMKQCSFSAIRPV